MKNEKTLIEKAVEAIKNSAVNAGKNVYELTRADLLSYLESSGDLTEWDFRKLGGLAAIRKSHFPESLDLGARRGVQLQRNYVGQLERALGDRYYFLDAVSKKMGEVLEEHPIQVANIKARAFKGPTNDKGPGTDKAREVVAFISDTHFGLKIDPEEVPANAYNWTIAARRMGKFAEQVASYKIEHRGSTPRLRLCLGGDLAQGVIHLDDAGTDLITNQVLGTVDILTKMIDYLRGFYKEIVVEAVSCNHLRLPHKSPGRATAQKWDAFSTIIHAMLQAAYRAVPQITFDVPKTPWADFEVLGHRFFMTHGDTTLEVGNPGKEINVKKITNEVDKLNSQVQGQRYEVVMLGHVHVPLSMTLDNGVELVVNGTGSGTDPYAQSIGIFSSRAIQTIFEVTEGYAVGDYRKIHLDDANNDSRYEKIIAPWSHSLVLDKVERK